MLLFNSLGKTLIKNTGWKSLVRSEVELSALNGLRLSIPEGVKQIIKISGKKADGKSAEIFIFKSEFGKNLGSRTLYSDGKIREIDISHTDGNIFSTRFDGDLKALKSFYSKVKTYHNVLKKGNKILYDSTTMSEVYENGHKLFPSFFLSRNPNPPENLNDIYLEVIKVAKTPNKNGTTDFRQQIMDIQCCSKKTKTFLDMKSTMAKDGEMILNSMEHSPSVNIDTKNPYYQFGLLNVDDMLRAQYAKIVKERGLKGIEPPLILDYTGRLKDSAGTANPCAKNISINMIDNQDIKEAYVYYLGHECEHMFTQFADIYLSGLKNLKNWLNSSSRKFYNGLKKRFHKVEKGSERYNRAVHYLEELKGYKKTSYNSDGSINIIDHDALILEKDANKAGFAERDLFLSWLDNMKKNFGLFNHEYVNSVK